MSAGIGCGSRAASAAGQRTSRSRPATWSGWPGWPGCARLFLSWACWPGGPSGGRTTTVAEGAAAGSRRAMVTGASSGIGEATARLLAARGIPVALVARRAEILERLASDLPGAIAVSADVADDHAMLQAVDQAEAALGPVDLLVNCAGIIGPRPLEQLTPDVWRRTVAINLSGTFYPCRELGLRMRSRGGGDIINVASDLAFTAMA